MMIICICGGFFEISAVVVLLSILGIKRKKND